jgi:hypothetical protein
VWYSLYTVFTAVRPEANRYAERAFLSATALSVMTLVVVLVLEEEGFDHAVSSECDGCDAEAGEGALEAVPPREGARVPPLLTARH